MNKKICFLLFAILSFCVTPAFSQAKDGIKKVMIDAGHGGKDAGAVGTKSKEKDINLAVALEVGKRIKEKCPDVEVYYTRTTDVYPTLQTRSKMANDKHADLFISIHCNASTNKTARGTETFVMGLHKTESNLAVARRENASMLLEDDYKSTYGNFDPNSPESYVIFSLYSNAYLDRSVKLAAKVQNNLVRTSQFTDRKVQQAGFWVLHSVAMPSILIELGFISNDEEEAKLINPDFQKQLAESIASAFCTYKNEAEGKVQPADNIATEDSPKQPDADQKTAADKDDKEKPADHDEAIKPEAATNSDAGIHFKVQFYATAENVSVSNAKFSGLPQVDKYKENNLWKFTSGDAASYQEIQKVLKTVKEKFPDAFVIAFKDGKKIPVSEARQQVRE